MNEAQLRAAVETIGWTLGGNLGKGGQGGVYKVTKKSGGSTVYAMKVLESPRKSAPERFVREIKAVQAITHPSIVRIIETPKKDAKLMYYVMEYHDGAKSLKEIVTKSDSPYFAQPEKALHLYMQLLRVLKACEEKKVVHRDLSLGNILVRRDGSLLLIDFGCCYIEDGKNLTLIGESIGTKHYKAPECEGTATTPPTIQADHYSAGKILWSLVTNKYAFAREKPVFHNMALNELLKGERAAWHLHHIFRQTIREKPTDRYQSVDKALGSAHWVLNLIKLRHPPLERLDQLASEDICHLCGVGKLRQPALLANNSATLSKIIKGWPDFEKWSKVCDY